METKKYFTISMDDGMEQDKKLVKLFRQYGLKATFNLNSGLMGEQSVIHRKVESGQQLPASQPQTIPANRIPADEVAQVYAGFEVATHGVHHKDQTTLTREELTEEILGDMQVLSQLFGYPVTGHAYPFGTYNPYVVDCLRENGILYARTVISTNAFNFPSDPLQFHPTCCTNEQQAFDLINAFVAAEPEQEDLLFCLWGHGFEFDYGTERGTWDYIERLCEKAAGHNDIIYCTNRDAFLRKENL